MMLVWVSVPPYEFGLPVRTRYRSRAVQFRSIGFAVRDMAQSACPCVLGYINPSEWKPWPAKSATISE